MVAEGDRWAWAGQAGVGEGLADGTCAQQSGPCSVSREEDLREAGVWTCAPDPLCCAAEVVTSL